MTRLWYARVEMNHLVILNILAPLPVVLAALERALAIINAEATYPADTVDIKVKPQ